MAVADGEVEVADGDREVAAGDIDVAAREMEVAARDVDVAGGDPRESGGDPDVAAGDLYVSAGHLYLADADRAVAVREATVAGRDPGSSGRDQRVSDRVALLSGQRHALSMPDDELRQLERATSEAPGDFVVGRRYVQALERAGDRRGAQLERLRLARSGDEETRAALRSLLPLPPRFLGRRPESPGDREPIGRSVTARHSVLAVDGFPTVLAATEDVLLVSTGRGLLAVDTGTLTERWRRAVGGEAAVALRATDLLVGDGHELVLVSAETGAELERATTPWGILGLATEHDRGAALVAANEGRLQLLVGLDLGRDFGRTLWKKIFPWGPVNEYVRPPVHGIADGWVFVGTDSARVFRVEDGAPPGDSAWRSRRAAAGRATESLDPGELAHLPELRWDAVPDRRYKRSSIARGRARQVFYLLSFGCAVVSVPGGDLVSPHGEFVNFVAYDTQADAVLIDRNLDVGRLGEFHGLELVVLTGAALGIVSAPHQLELYRFETT
jgi:hypothetical protein